MQQNNTPYQNKNINQSPHRAEIKKMRADEAVRRASRKKIIWVIVVVIILAVLIGGSIWYSNWGKKHLPGIAYPNQGQEHIKPGQEHVAYNSNPPTSGPHFEQPAKWGIYKEELPDETLIHNLEHGGIWISYKPGIAEDLRKKLEHFYEKWGAKIIVTPRAKNDTDVVLAAWTRLDTFSAADYSENRVERFIEAFRNKGPELIMGDL